MRPEEILYLIKQHSNWMTLTLAAFALAILFFLVREIICWFYKTNRLARKLEKVLALLEAQEQREQWRKKTLLCESAEDDPAMEAQEPPAEEPTEAREEKHAESEGGTKEEKENSKEKEKD